MRMIRLADGYQPVALGSVTLFIICLFYYYVSQWFIYFLPLIIIIFVINLFFHRNPPRTIIVDSNAIISPADGRIYEIDNENKVIRIRMNLFDVHVNRSPISGKIIKIIREKGSYWPFLRFIRRGTLNNARQKILIDSRYGIVTVVQISGFIARRCVCYYQEEDEVKQGDIIGMIRFGSEVDVHLPKEKDFLITVSLGDRVIAGKTKIAIIK